MPKYAVTWCEENWFETSVDAADMDAAQDLVFGIGVPGSRGEPYEIKTTEVFVEEVEEDV